MKTILNFLLVLIFAKNSLALQCKGCEVTNLNEPCDFSYKCPKGTKSCETLVSKVNGNYSIVLACATDDKCKANPIFEDGLSECKHSKSDTECYTCCEEKDCNTLELALEELPKDIFEVKRSKKDKKIKSKKIEEEDDVYTNDENSESEENEELDDDSLDIDTEEKSEKNKTEEKSDETEEIKVNDSESNVEKTGDAMEINPEVFKNSKDTNETEKSVENNSEAVNGAEVFENNDLNVIINEDYLETENSTDQITVNNGGLEEEAPPLDENLNIQAIDKEFNGTVVIEKDGNDFNVQNSDKKTENVTNVNQNASQNPNTANTPENSAYDLGNMVASNAVGTTTLYLSNDSEDVGMSTNSSSTVNIITEGENANQITENNELTQSKSSEFKISSAALAFSSIMILIRLF